MSNDGDVANHLGVGSQAEHEAGGASASEQISFLLLRCSLQSRRQPISDSLIIPPLLRSIARPSTELANLDRFDDGLGQRLSILLLNHRLNVGAEDGLSGGVVSLVIMEDDGV